MAFRNRDLARASSLGVGPRVPACGIRTQVRELGVQSILAGTSDRKLTWVNAFPRRVPGSDERTGGCSSVVDLVPRRTRLQHVAQGDAIACHSASKTGRVRSGDASRPKQARAEARAVDVRSQGNGSLSPCDIGSRQIQSLLDVSQWPSAGRVYTFR